MPRLAISTAKSISQRTRRHISTPRLNNTVAKAINPPRDWLMNKLSAKSTSVITLKINMGDRHDNVVFCEMMPAPSAKIMMMRVASGLGLTVFETIFGKLYSPVGIKGNLAPGNHSTTKGDISASANPINKKPLATRCADNGLLIKA